MKQADLIAGLATASALPKDKIREVLTNLGVAITVAVKSDDDVTIPGVGKISRVLRSARTGRNPHTGAAIQVPAKNQVKFKVSKELADAVA